MKAVLLAGGLGTRISEESHLKPKPMIEIGNRPILWHIMKIYSHYGINDFIICCGYRAYVIKEYFANYFLHNSDVTFDMVTNSKKVHQSTAEPWKVTVIDTGAETQTGGRLKRVREYLGDEDFCFTYGDGVSNVDIKKLIAFHKEKGRLATLTATLPPGRFGQIGIEDDLITSFVEKPHGEGGYINGGFFILNPKVIELIEGDDSVWEKTPMETLAKRGQMAAYSHDGFWQPMDTLRDKNFLEELWKSGNAPWKLWT